MTLPATILYVDDEPLNLMLFSTMFGKKYKVLTAESGDAGLAILQKHPDIRVVISDMKMPGMNGIEFIKRARVLYPVKLFFIHTGYDITPEIQQSIKEGLIAEYFQKPFDMKVIDSSITSHLNSAA
jgi:response regulator RpfG family c-di-GMP phosphodiesterase